jgi:hypothetical protein
MDKYLIHPKLKYIKKYSRLSIYKENRQLSHMSKTKEDATVNPPPTPRPPRLTKGSGTGVGGGSGVGPKPKKDTTVAGTGGPKKPTLTGTDGSGGKAPKPK